MGPCASIDNNVDSLSCSAQGLVDRSPEDARMGASCADMAGPTSASSRPRIWTAAPLLKHVLPAM